MPQVGDCWFGFLLSPDSSFPLKPTGFYELAALLEHHQTCQLQDGSSGAAEPGSRTSSMAWLHAWLS